MRKRTKKQNTILHALMGKLRINEDLKKDMVYDFTNGRTIHTSEMSIKEADEMIRFLRSEINKNDREFQSDRMRKKIIAKFVDMGYVTKEGKADMPRIYAWVEKYGYLHKHLNKYTYEELPKLVSKNEKSYYSFLKTVANSKI